MKKVIALALTVCLLAGLLVAPAAAADSDAVDAVNMVRALGIMIGDQNGNLNLSANVTRAEFSKMLVAASTYKDTVGGSSGYSLFKDVKSSHWAVEYIKVTVENGWFVGYMDGTFRPNKSITLEEAATVALRLLGYTSTDLAGSYPTAQLSKFNALGLHDGFSTKQGQIMTRSDCAHLFYNLMAAKTKDGQIYAQTLGYTLDGTGHVDYASLVSSGTSGPYTLASGSIASRLPFTTSGITVYRNGAASTLSAAGTYDIYYYNENLRTVWIYSNRVTGTFTAASPSAAAPTSVTVAGVAYSIETSGAAYKLSTQGAYSIGDTVTLLLGMSGGVADVCDAAAATGTYYGVVTETKAQSVTSASGQVTVSNTVIVACTDGVERSFEVGSSSYSDGALVEINYADASSPLSRLSSKAASGQVSSDGKSFGSLKLADDVKILDTDRYGNYMRVYPSRLAGSSLTSSHVLYYALDAQGEISHLILRDGTGDLNSYGIITEAQNSSAGVNVSSSYTCIINGSEITIGSANTSFGASKGAAMFCYDGNELASVRNLSKTPLASLTATAARASNQTYAVSENVQVYILKNGDYFAASISSVADSGKYSLTGYYDSLGYAAGSRIRVVVATEQ